MEITLDKQKTVYYLCQKDRVFRDKTLSGTIFFSLFCYLCVGALISAHSQVKMSWLSTCH